MPNGGYALNVAPEHQRQHRRGVADAARRIQPLPHWDFRSWMTTPAPSPTTYHTTAWSRTPRAPVLTTSTFPPVSTAPAIVTGTRASAPFAILDTVYQAVQLVLSVAPNTDFPALVLDWADRQPGRRYLLRRQLAPISTSCCRPTSTEDTDEFDQHVIAHEFGHYIEFNFSRADNIGGAHGLGDKLDIRVAFGEGFGYAFGAIVLDDPVTRDTFVDTSCTNSQCSSTFNVEDNPATLAHDAVPAGNFGCWCSESSVWSILWDVYDTNADTDDTVALGFAPIWNVLVNRATHYARLHQPVQFHHRAEGRQCSQRHRDQHAGRCAEHQWQWHRSPTARARFTAPAPVANNGSDAAVHGYHGGRRAGDRAQCQRCRHLQHARQSSLSCASRCRAHAPSRSRPHRSALTGDADFVLFRDGAFYDLSWDSPPDPETLVVNNAPRRRLPDRRLRLRQWRRLHP